MLSSEYYAQNDGFGEPFDGGLMQHSLLADGVADTLNGQYAVMDSGGSYSESPDGSPDNGTPPGAGLAGYAKSSSRSNSGTFEMNVILLHKPRGSKGVWEKVMDGDVLRVTREKGKRLKLQCRSEFPFDYNSVSIYVVDLVNMEVCNEGVTVEKVTADNSQSEFVIEMEIKLFVARKRIQLTVQAPLRNHEEGDISGRTIQFKTTSSGGAMKPMSPANDSEHNGSDQDSSPSHGPNYAREMPPLPLPPAKRRRLDSPPHKTSEPEPAYMSSAHQKEEHAISNQAPIPPQMAVQPHYYNPSSNAMDMSGSTITVPNPMPMKPLPNVVVPNNYSAPPPQPEINPMHYSIEAQPVTVVPNSLDVRGAVRAKAFYQLSDIRLKYDVEEIVDALTIVSNLEGKTYKWKKNSPEGEGEHGGKRVIGFIAQQVQQVLPEAVREEEDGYLAVNYESMIPVLVEAMKQHLQEYQTDKMDFQDQLDDLRVQLDEGANKSDDMHKFLKHLQELMKSKKLTFISPRTKESKKSKLKRMLYNKKFHIAGGIIAGLFIAVGLALLIFNNVVNLPALNGQAVARILPGVQYMGGAAAKPPAVGKPPTAGNPSTPSTTPVSIAPDGSIISEPALNDVYIALNVVGSILLCLGVALGVTVVVFFVKARNR
jgi:hypothetical protein